MTGYEALRERAAWIDLSKRGEIRVSGEDRARLLHAMCTNHVQELRFGDGLYAFFLNPQGRILGDAYVYDLGDTLLLDTEPETGRKIRDHLEKYIIADDVTLEDETEQWATVGLEGPETEARAAELGIAIPEKKYCFRNWKNGFVARVASTGTKGVRIFVPSDQKQELVRRFEAVDIPNASQEEARIVRLENGIPRYGEDISERYLVQETQAMHGVHSNKGCYLGQEIVERVRSRAQIHRVLMPVHIKGTQVPRPGTKLAIDGKDAAEITSAAFSPGLGEVVALAYVRTEAARSKAEMAVAGREPLAAAYIP